MSDVLEGLTYEFIDRPSAPARVAVEYFSSSTKAALEKTLRYHGDDPVTGRLTIARRASFDSLLSFYGLLEIASMEGLVTFSGTAARRAKRHLEDQALIAYYEDYYPLLLPQLFRRRLDGRPLAIASASTPFESRARFARFQGLMQMLEDPDPQPGEWTDVEVFWWLLDDGMTEDGYVASDLVDAFAGQAQMACEALLGEDRSVLHSAIRGLYQFLRFANELEPFLEGQPVLVGSVYWHHFGYWFNRMGQELNRVMRDVLVKIDSGDGSAETLLIRVSRLTSGRYGWPLYEAAALAGEAPVAMTEGIAAADVVNEADQPISSEADEPIAAQARAIAVLERQLIKDALDNSHKVGDAARRKLGAIWTGKRSRFR